MQTNWIIASNPEKIMEKLAEETGLHAWEKTAWTDHLQGSSPLLKGLRISDFPNKDQDGERIAAFAYSLRDYVLSGGCLTVKGESASLLPLVFPDTVMGTRWIEAGQAVFSVSDPALANLVGSSIQIETPVPVEVPRIENDGLRTFVQTDVPNPVALVFSFQYGNGLVICQPFPLGTFDQDDILLVFLAAIAQSQSLRVSMFEKVRSQHAAVMAEYPLLLSKENPAFSIEFTPPQGKNAMVLLHWEGDARVHLHIDDEQQRMALNHTRESSPFAWYSPMPNGKWYCKTELIESHENVLPALLTCCSIDSPARKKLPQEYRFNPSKVQRCPKCKMPLNPTMKFCPACGRKVEKPTPR